MKEIKIIEQALNIAAKNGVFTIKDCAEIDKSLEKVKDIIEQEDNRRMPMKDPTSSKKAK